MKSILIIIILGFLTYSAMSTGIESLIDSIEASKAERHANIERVVNGN